jgi:hypothetical protein
MFRKNGIESRASVCRDTGVLWTISIDLREGTEVEDDFYTFGTRQSGMVLCVGRCK